MRKKFEIYRTKITDGCQLRRKVVTHNSKSDLPLVQGQPYNLLEQERNLILYFIHFVKHSPQQVLDYLQPAAILVHKS